MEKESELRRGRCNVSMWQQVRTRGVRSDNYTDINTAYLRRRCTAENIIMRSWKPSAEEEK